MNRLTAPLVVLITSVLLGSAPDAGIGSEPPTGVVAVFQTPDQSGLTQIALQSANQILLGSAQGGIWLWNPAKDTIAEQRPPAPAGDPITQLAWDDSGRLFAGSGPQLLVRSGPGDFVPLPVPRLPQLAVSPTGRQMAGVGEDPPILFFSADSGKPTHRVDRQVWVDDLRYSPSGEFLATSRFGRLYLWNSDTGELVWKSRLEGKIKGFAFSPDRTAIFVSMAQEGLWVIDAKTGRIADRYSRRHNNVDESQHHMAISPDGMLLADTPASTRIEIWETFTGRPVLLLGKHPGNITEVCFLEDGRRLVSVDDQGHAYLWDLGTAEFADPFDVTKRYSQEELRQLWGMLGEPRGSAAWSALVALRHRPEQALELIGDPPDDERLIKELIKRLDDDEFTVRQAASRALHQLSLKAEPFLRKTLSTSDSAEVKVRIRRLLGALAGPHREAQMELLEQSRHHRQLRVVQLLKWIGTAEAKERIEELRDASEVPAIRNHAAAAIRDWDGESGSRE